MEPTEKRPSPAYVPHETFLRLISQIRELGRAPTTIDNSVLNGYSGSIRAQLIPAMRFLGLIDRDNRSLPPLKAIAVATDDTAVTALLRQGIDLAYADIIAGIDLQATTPPELTKAFKERTAYDGETLKRAVRFFVAAGKHVGMDLSPLLSKRQAPSPRKPKPPSQGKEPAETKRDNHRTPPPPTPPPAATGYKRFAVLHLGVDDGVIEHPLPLTEEWCESAAKTLAYLKGNAIPKKTK